MRIEQIKQLIEIAKTGSINAAAKNLYIAQSSLSSSVKAAETELGNNIFVREGNKLTLTNFGHNFIQSGEKILSDYQEILNLASSDDIVTNEHFSVSVYFLEYASVAFSELCNCYNHNAINFSFREQSRMDIINNVSHGISELGFLSMPSYNKHLWKYLLEAYNLEFVKLSDEPTVLIYGEKSELFKKDYKEIDKSFLRGRRMVIIDDDNDIFKSINNHLIEITKPGSFLCLSDRASLSTMLHYQDVYFVGTKNVNAYNKTGDFYNGLKSSILTDISDYKFEIGYVKKSDAELSKYASEYLTIIKRYMKV